MKNREIVQEDGDCPLCGSVRRSFLLRNPDRWMGVPGIFTHWRCVDCDLIYQAPRPSLSSLAQIYPDDYPPYQKLEVTPGEIHHELRAACRFIARHQPRPGRLLDIGCGPGNLLMALQLLQPGWELAGIEPHEASARQAQARGLDVQWAVIESAILSANSWDAVVLWNVLEHLPDPLGALRRIRQLLRSDGRLYLAVPMADSWDAYLLGRYWMGWELPRHFVVFTRMTLSAMLARAGFTIIDQACNNGVEWNVTESLRLLVRDRAPSYASLRLGVQITYSRPFRMLLRLLVMVAAFARRSSVLSVVAGIQENRMP